jgi:hypothetical protein
MGLHRASI